MLTKIVGSIHRHLVACDGPIRLFHRKLDKPDAWLKQIDKEGKTHP